MKRKFLYIFIINVLFVSLLYAQDSNPFIEGEKLEFQLTDLYGNIVSENDIMFDGKVIYMTLWATWCPPCISEIPTLIELLTEFQDSGLVIIGIAFERSESYNDRRDKLLKFTEEHNINYLVLDGGPPNNFENIFPNIKNVEGLPIEILIDRKGDVAVIRNSFGFSKVWAGRLQQEIKTLLK